MQYTLKQAMQILAPSSHAYGVSDLRASINRALQSLAGMAPWECLRKTLRFVSAGPEFALPQGCAGLVRACVNGRPMTMRGRDFRFLQSGPGDALHPPAGYMRVPPGNVMDLGWSPVMADPPAPARLIAFADGPNEPPVSVRGFAPDGREIRAQIRPYAAGGPVDLDSAVPSDEVFQAITEVVIDDSASAYAALYASDMMAPAFRYPVGTYHPEIKAPQFRHYRLQGVRPGPVGLLVETRIDPVPLVRDTDIVPLPSIDPIEWMIRYDWLMKANEIDAATKYQNQAAQWLKAQEIMDDTVQTPIIVNSVFEGSMGEVSEEAYNI